MNRVEMFTCAAKYAITSVAVTRAAPIAARKRSTTSPILLTFTVRSPQRKCGGINFDAASGSTNRVCRIHGIGIGQHRGALVRGRTPERASDYITRLNTRTDPDRHRNSPSVSTECALAGACERSALFQA